MPMGGTPVTLVPDGTAGATSAGIVTVGQLPAAAAGADTTANPTTSQIFAANELFNGTTWDRQRAAPGTTGVPSVNTEGTKATYSAAGVFAPAAAATDVFTITGSATKTIRVLRMTIGGQATAAINVAMAIIKRSAANTSGTPATITAAPHDSANAAATALVQSWTANPSLGATVATVRQQFVTLNAATPGFALAQTVFDFTTRNGQGIVLRGIAQVLALNFAGNTVSGNLLAADVEWTEE